MQQNISYWAMVVVSFIILFWTFLWKGIALWTAAKHDQKSWFIFLLVCVLPVIFFNGIGVIDLVYLFFFAKKRLTFSEIKSWKKYGTFRMPEKHKTRK